MPEANGNMTHEERMALQHGAVVSWQSKRRLAEQLGAVDRVHPTGTLELADATMVYRQDYCRLVSAAPMVATQPEVRGLDGDGVAPEGKPRAARAETANATATATAAATAPAKWAPKGGKRCDRAAWLAAVRAVRVRMEGGEALRDAIAAVAPTCGVKLTEAAYYWWRRTLIAEGMEKPGGKTMPRKPDVPAVPTAAKPEDIGARIEETARALRRLIAEGIAAVYGRSVIK